MMGLHYFMGLYIYGPDSTPSKKHRRAESVSGRQFVDSSSSSRPRRRAQKQPRFRFGMVQPGQHAFILKHGEKGVQGFCSGIQAFPN